MAGGVSRPKNIHKYAKQCQEAYQDLKNIENQTPAANVAENQYNQGTNTNTNTSTNTGTNAKTANHSEHSVNSLYSHFPFVALNPTVIMHPACSKVTKLTKKKIAKLQCENQCFHCKRVGDYWSWCLKEWQSMTTITNSTTLVLVNVSEVAVPQPSHVKTENV